MGKYINPQDVWNAFGKGAFHKVRNETLGTGSGAYVTYSTSQDNLISGSEKIFANSNPIFSYSINYDEGEISLTASSGVVYSANYNYAQLPNSYIEDIIAQSEEELEYLTGRKFSITTTSETINIERQYYPRIFVLSNYPVISIIGISGNTNTMVSPVWQDFSGYCTASNNYLFFDSSPQAIQLKVDYVYGYDEIPPLVQELAVCLAQRKIMNAGIYKSVVGGDSFTNEAELTALNNRISHLIKMLGRVSVDKI